MSIRLRIVLFALPVLIPLLVGARAIKIMEPQLLVAQANLVFIGQIKSVAPSAITTELTYPGYAGVTFRWQIAKVVVLEPFKGVARRDVIQIAALSVDKNSRVQLAYDPPGMLEPHPNDIFFFCLKPTPLQGVFAALTAPYDENLSILSLHRNETDLSLFVNDGFLKSAALRRTNMLSATIDSEKQRDEEYALIFSLTDKSGKTQPASIEKFNEAFAGSLEMAASSNLVYLEWKTYTNPQGWRSDVPKDEFAGGDGDGLRRILSFGGIFIFAAGLFAVVVWLCFRLFARKCCADAVTIDQNRGA